jgi:nitrogen regulatory protein PII
VLRLGSKKGMTVSEVKGFGRQKATPQRVR